MTVTDEINRINVQYTKGLIVQKNPTEMRRQSLRQTAELYKKGTKVLQISLKDDEEAKGEPPVSECNESSENNQSCEQSEKLKIPLIHSEKPNDFNILEEKLTPVVETIPKKPQEISQEPE